MILSCELEEYGHIKNNPSKTIRITLNEEITVSNINSILPNNGDNYTTTDGINYLPDCSEAKIVTPLYFIIAIFVSNVGNVSSKTGYKNGEWRILSKNKFIIE